MNSSLLKQRFMLLSLFATALQSNAQTLDLTFGTGGYSSNDFNAAQERVQFLEITPDGKIMTGGILRALFTVDDDQWFLTRFESNGMPDTTFNGNGFKRLNPCLSHDITMDMYLAPDGYTYLMGYENWNQPPGWAPYDQVTICRVDVNGALDVAYGINGFDYFYYGDDSYGFAIGPALGGGTNVLLQKNSDLSAIYLARRTPGGSTDLSFGNSGVVEIHSPENPGLTLFMKQAIRANGGGFFAYGTAMDNRLLIAKIDVNGILDSSFSTDGWVSEPGLLGNGAVGSTSSMRALEDTQGRLLVYGIYGELGWFVRYLPNGDRDPSFGNNGVVDFMGTPGVLDSRRIDGLTVDEFGRIILSTKDRKLHMFNDLGQSIIGFGVNGAYDIPTTEPTGYVRGGLVKALPGGNLLTARLVDGPSGPAWTTTWVQLNRFNYDMYTSISPNLESSVPSLYPNPATNALILTNAPQAVHRYSMLDVLGRQVAGGKWKGDPIPVDHLRPGTYVLLLADDEGDAMGTIMFIKE